MRYNLFPDTEILEDVYEDVLGGDLADYGAEAVDGQAEVFGGQFGRETGGQAVTDAEEGSAGVGQGLNVALVCDECGVAVAEEVALSRGQKAAQSADSGAGFCGDREEIYDVFRAVFFKMTHSG